MYEIQTIKIAPSLKAKFIHLQGKNLRRLQQSCPALSGKAPHKVGEFNVYVEGCSALQLTYKNHSITLIFYDWIRSIRQVRKIYRNKRLKQTTRLTALLSHIYLFVYDGNVHFAFETTSKALIFALTHQVEPEIAPLLCAEQKKRRNP